MDKWIIETNDGSGWGKVQWAGSFNSEEEAWDFAYGTEWDGPVRVIQIIDEDY